MATVVAFGGLSEDVGGRVPEDAFAWMGRSDDTPQRQVRCRRTFGVLKVEQLEAAAALQRAFEVPDRAVNLTCM